MRGHSLRNPNHTARLGAEPSMPICVGRSLRRRAHANRGYAVQADVKLAVPTPPQKGRLTKIASIRPLTLRPFHHRDRRIQNTLIRAMGSGDVRTDASGSGTSQTTVPFVFTDRGPGSIVIHDAEQTQAGQAGAPIACLSLSATRHNLV